MAESDAIAQIVVIIDRKCELCAVNNVTWQCLNCNESICDHCKSIHIKSKASKNHKIVSLRDVDKLESSGDTDNTKCTVHPNEDMSMYCASCDVPVCRKCIADESHKNHSILLIEDVIDQKKIEISNLAQKFRERIKKHEETLQSTNSRQDNFDAEISKRIEKVHHRNEDLKQKLDTITSEFVNQLQSQHKRTHKHASDLERRLQNQIREMRIQVLYCERKRSDGNAQLVKYVADMKDRLDIYTPCDPPNIDHPPDLLTKNVDIQDLKVLFGELVEGKPETKQIKKSIPYLEVKILNTFTLQGLVAVDCVVTAGLDQVALMWRLFYKQSEEKAWVWSYGYKELRLITSDGHVVQNVKTDLKIYDLAVVKSGEVLLTVHGGKVMKLLSDGKLKVVFNSQEFKARGITATDTGNAFVGLCGDKVDSKLVEITVNGREIRTVQYDEVDNSVLFVYPHSLCTNINGDIVVVDDHSEVIVIDQKGHLKYIYDGQRKGLEHAFNPQCVVTDRQGNIIISDVGNSVLHLLRMDGQFLRILILKKRGDDEPRGLSIDAAGILWVCTRNTVMRVNYL